MSSPSLSTLVFTSLGSGVAGWVLENALFTSPGRPRYSALLPNTPFLPVYAVGGAAIAMIQPRIQHMHPVARLLIYGIALTSIEGTAGYLERSDGRMSWDYGGSPIDVPHAVAWAFLGLLTGAVIHSTVGEKL
jgi:uncharacterized membrane protein